MTSPAASGWQYYPAIKQFDLAKDELFEHQNYVI
jgi:hypothetical protein